MVRVADEGRLGTDLRSDLGEFSDQDVAVNRRLRLRCVHFAALDRRGLLWLVVLIRPDP
jgi:hypothetical protein